MTFQGVLVSAERKDPASHEHLQHHDLLESLMGTKPGDPICVLYEYSPIEKMEAVTAYLREGIEQGEQSIYVADELPVDHVEQWFRAGGVDLAQEKQRGALLIWTREQWRQPGALDTIRKAAQVREIVHAAFRSGFAGVRFAVEMTWTLRPDIDPSAIEEWESLSNQFLAPGAPVRAVCLYGRKRLPRETIEAGLKTHPLVLNGPRLQANDRFGR